MFTTQSLTTFHALTAPTMPETEPQVPAPAIPLDPAVNPIFPEPEPLPSSPDIPVVPTIIPGEPDSPSPRVVPEPRPEIPGHC